MKRLLVLSLILKLSFVFGQDFSYPIIIQQGEKISDFIPNNWTIRDSATGDLNNDLKKDIALVLQFKDSITLTKNGNSSIDTVITQPRILVILLGDSITNKFLLEEQSNSFILNHDNQYMDDPFDGLQIEKGVLIINFRIWYSWGSWWTSNSSYKFRFQNNEFVLIGCESSSYHRSSQAGRGYSINFLTHRYSISTGEMINEDYKSKEEWKTFKLPVLKTFRTFKEPYTWNFSDEITL